MSYNYGDIIEYKMDDFSGIAVVKGFSISNDVVILEDKSCNFPNTNYMFDTFIVKKENTKKIRQYHGT